ncbi:MAG TPA: hypothetical protein VF060_11900 [Trebonia sp.]
MPASCVVAWSQVTPTVVNSLFVERAGRLACVGDMGVSGSVSTCPRAGPADVVWSCEPPRPPAPVSPMIPPLMTTTAAAASKTRRLVIRCPPRRRCPCLP